MKALAREIAREAGAGAAGARRLLATTAAVTDRCRMDPVGDIGGSRSCTTRVPCDSKDGCCSRRASW